jgi:glutamate racemase
LNFMNKSNPVGFLSSGIGGLTVVKEAMSLLPNENLIFYADTARAPYGVKSNEAIIKFSAEGAKFLRGRNIKLLVVASNSISAAAMDEIRNNIDLPVIGVVEPASRLAVETTRNKKIGVIGSQAVINNKTYSSQIKIINSKVKVYETDSPLLEGLAEAKAFDPKAIKAIIKEYTEPLKEKGIDTLILGSVYYSLLAEYIAKASGKNINIISSGIPSSFVLKNYLEGRGIRSQSVQIGQPEFYVSDLNETVINVSTEIFGRKKAEFHKIDL